MDPMIQLSLLELSMIADIVTTIITFIGIIMSMWLSLKALKEVQIDRRLRQKPLLGFEYGGWQIPIEFKKAGKTIPGLNPSFVEKVFSNLPEEAESVRIKKRVNKNGFARAPRFYGKLKNYGLGTALSTTVSWIPQEICIDSEKFIIDNNKLLEPPYQKILNTMPSCPSHILPSENGELSRLPTFIEKDFEKKVSEVTGFLEIECEGIFGEKHLVKQRFYIFTKYMSENPFVHVTFMDFIKNE